MPTLQKIECPVLPANFPSVETETARPRCDHKSVGLIVRRAGSILLIARKKPPVGYAPPAGHIDAHGGFLCAARKELMEEVGLSALSLRLVYCALHRNMCRRPLGQFHYWVVYEVNRYEVVSSHSPDEVASLDWFDKKNLFRVALRTRLYLDGRVSPRFWQKNPGLEPIWLHIFENLNLISG